MASTQTAEWDADLPDDLRDTADNLQASLDAFERGLADRIHRERVQPVKVEVEELAGEIDEATDRLTTVEGQVREGREDQESLTARLQALETSSATRVNELETTLAEGLDAAKRAREGAERDAEVARESLRADMPGRVDTLSQKAEERALGLDQRIAEERQRTDALDERGEAIAAGIRADRQKAGEVAAETDRRFDAAENARSELHRALTQALESRTSELSRQMSAADQARKDESDAIRGNLGELQERLSKHQGEASQHQADVDTRFQTLRDTREREREEYLHALAELREQLEEAGRLRISDLEGVESRLSEAAAARSELSSRLGRYQKLAMSLGAIALVLALAAIILMNT